MDYVIAKDAATARKAGRAVEAALARDTRANRALVTKATKPLAGQPFMRLRAC